MPERTVPKHKLRMEATIQGLKHYFTGEPCTHGHISTRFTSSGRCVECVRIEKGGKRRWGHERTIKHLIMLGMSKSGLAAKERK